jgi:hypothetical protein
MSVKGEAELEYRPATTDLPITMRLAEPPGPCELSRGA